MTVCAELYGLEIPACVIPVLCVPSGLVTTRIGPSGIFLAFELISHLEVKYHFCCFRSAQQTFVHPNSQPSARVRSHTHDDGRSSRPTNQSVNQSISRFHTVLLSVWFTRLMCDSLLYNTHTLTRVETSSEFVKLLINPTERIRLSVRRRLPASLQEARPNISTSRKMLKRHGQMQKKLSYCKTKRARLSAQSWGLCTAMKLISWVMILHSKASIVALFSYVALFLPRCATRSIHMLSLMRYWLRR